MPKMIFHKVMMAGTGEFPIDMLRYDMLAPHSEEDSVRIARTFYVCVQGTDKWEIILCRWAEKNWEPCIGRWESFGCKIIDHQSIK